MNNIIRIAAALLFLSLLPSLAQSQALTMPKFKKGAWSIYNEYQYYSSSKNYGNEAGQVEDLTADNNYKLHENIIRINYGLLKKLRLSSLFRLAYGSADTAGTVRNHGSLTDIGLGADYQAIEGRFSLYPGFEFSIPLTTVTTDTDDSIINEGALQFTAKAYADFKLNFLDLYSQLSFIYLTDGRGGRYGVIAGAKKAFGNFLLNLEVNGTETLINDEFTEQSSQRNDVTERVNAGSFVYYSINPGLWKFAAQGRYKVHRSTIMGLGVSKDFYGARSASGLGIHVFAEIRLGEIWPQLSGKRRVKTPESDFRESKKKDPEMKYFKKDPTQPKKKRKKRSKKKRTKKKKKKKAPPSQSDTFGS